MVVNDLTKTLTISLLKSEINAVSVFRLFFTVVRYRAPDTAPSRNDRAGGGFMESREGVIAKANDVSD